jgi:predicted esterase
MKHKSCLFIFFLVLSSYPLKAQDHIVQKFIPKSHTYQGVTIPYQLFIPDESNHIASFPLVLALHGSGERGSDNLVQIQRHRLATSWADPMNQSERPCFVVAPQCPSGSQWTNNLEFLNNLLDTLIHTYPVNQNRLYITGLSMGGYGTWAMITTYPNIFAAAVPMSGGYYGSSVDAMLKIPIWNFHGVNDYYVPVSVSRSIIKDLEDAGRTCVFTHCNWQDCTGVPDSVLAQEIADGVTLLYTEYPNKSHNIWTESYNNPYLMEWVFAQDKRRISVDQISESLMPKQFVLYQNFPNPFNGSTVISFQSSVLSLIRVNIYNALGQHVRSLLNGHFEAGYHEIVWNGIDDNGHLSSSGVYIYQLQVGDVVEQKKMILVK